MLKTKAFSSKNVLYLCIVSLVLFLLPGLTPLAFGEDELDIKKDKEKTVYTIGGSKDDQKKDEDKENSWEMLKNVRPWIQVK